MATKHVLDQFRLDGKVALITGGTRGLGFNMATALGQVGADIAIVGRSIEPARQSAEALESATGRKVRAFAGDVTSDADVRRLVAEVEREFGAVDVLVNSAGINIRGNADQLSETDWDTVVDINLKGTFLCSRAAGPKMTSAPLAASKVDWWHGHSSRCSTLR